MRRPALTLLTVRTALAVLAALALALGAPALAGAAVGAAELRVVTVLPDAAAGATSVVAELDPAPSGPLPQDAAEVTAGGSRVPATIAPLLDTSGRTALVVDASVGAADALPQVLSGAAAYVLRLPQEARITVTVDGTPPRSLTTRPVPPTSAIQALVDVRAAGSRSTTAALELALRDVPATGAGRPLVLLQTGSAPPQDPEQVRRLAERLRDSRAVLAVATGPGLAPAWTELAAPTGGLAVEAAPTAVADAFDEVARALRKRWAITFKTPPGASSAELRLRSGGDVLSAAVALPQVGQGRADDPAASSPQDAPKQPAEPSRPGTRPVAAGIAIAAAVAAAFAAVVAAAVVVRRRRRAGRVPIPVGAPPAENPPRGVRMFDLSNPALPVEIGRARPERDDPVEVAPEAGEQVEVAPETGERVEVAPETGERVEVAPETGERVEVAPETDGHNGVRVPADLNGHEVAAEAGDHVEVTSDVNGNDVVAETGEQDSVTSEYIGRHRSGHHRQRLG